MSEPLSEDDTASRKANDRIKELQTLLEEAIIVRQEAERSRIEVLCNLADAGRRQADEMQKRLDAERRQADQARKRAEAERMAAHEARKRAEAERVATDEVRRRAEAEARAADLESLVAKLRGQLQQPGGEP